MKNKTPLAKLIGYLDSIQGCSTHQMIQKAKELLAEEKQMVIDAFTDARIKPETNDYGTFGYHNSEQYFTQNYEQ